MGTSIREAKGVATATLISRSRIIDDLFRDDLVIIRGGSKTRRSYGMTLKAKGALMTIDYCSKITPLLPTGAKQYLPADMSPVICGELSLENAVSRLSGIRALLAC
jgi:hypothetical protein